MAYAEKTSVSVAKTKADIEELIQKAGAGVQSKVESIVFNN